MSWRAGSQLFWTIWPQVDAGLAGDEARDEFVGKLVELFLDLDVDPQDLRSRDPEIDRIMDRVDPPIVE